jgi:hypothetical protein
MDIVQCLSIFLLHQLNYYKDAKSIISIRNGPSEHRYRIS